MRKLAAVLVLGAFACALAAEAVHPATTRATVPGKRCRLVVKKVNGHKHKVRVCTRRKPAPAPTEPPIATPSGLAKIALPGQPTHVAVGVGSVWVTGKSGVVLRIDPVTNAIVRRYDLPFSFCGPTDGVYDNLAPVAAAGALWLDQCSDGGGALRLNAETGAVTRVPAGRGFAYGAGSMWAHAFSGSVVRLDPATGKSVKTLSVSQTPLLFGTGAFDFGSYWFSDFVDGAVIRVDAATTSVAATIPVGAAYGTGPGVGPLWLAAGGGAVWVVNNSDGGLYRIDPATNTSTRVRGVYPGAPYLDIALDSVWFRWAGNEVARLDPATDRVVARYRTGAEPIALAGGFGSIWVVNGKELWRITP
jgi:DNA-binding beta-propeller fold protein YncE